VKICAAYTAVTFGPKTSDFIARFVASWLAFPPGAECDLFVCCNGGPLNTEQSAMLAPLKPKMFPRKNDAGRDVTGYMDLMLGPAASYDAVLCLGQSLHFRKAGWLKRLIEAWQKWGEGFYGFFGSFFIRAHLQTSAFCCSPRVLKLYPIRPYNRAQRYAFEFGDKALWRRAVVRGYPARLVTWDGEWLPREWRTPANILWRGTQENLLFHHNHAENWEKQTPEIQRQWSARADSMFQ
jgi:hypothetical protein